MQKSEGEIAKACGREVVATILMTNSLRTLI